MTTKISSANIQAATLENLQGAKIYNTLSSLPASGNADGDLAYVTETSSLYIWLNSTWSAVSAASTGSSGGIHPFLLSGL